MRFSVTLFSPEIYGFSEQPSAEGSSSGFLHHSIPRPEITCARDLVSFPKSAAIITQPCLPAEGANPSPASRGRLTGSQISLCSRSSPSPATTGAHDREVSAAYTPGLRLRSALARSQLSVLAGGLGDLSKSPSKIPSVPAAGFPAAIRAGPGFSLAPNCLLGCSWLMANPFNIAFHLQPLIKIKWRKLLSARKIRRDGGEHNASRVSPALFDLRPPPSPGSRAQPCRVPPGR